MFLAKIGITPKDKKPKISVQQFFQLVKNNMQKPELYVNRVNDYMSSAKYARQLGQTALFEQILTEIQLVKYESKLLAADFCTVITEEQIVTFYKDSSKGLSLTDIKNFARIIPEKVCKQKDAADTLHVFDNYVILHYDPQQKAFKETAKEKAAKRDPILFGIIAGHPKLYYIADWIDEYCDLTLQDFIKKFGQEAIRANDITVNYKPQKKV